MEEFLYSYFVNNEFQMGHTRWYTDIYFLETPAVLDPIKQEILILFGYYEPTNAFKARSLPQTSHAQKSQMLIEKMRLFYPEFEYKYHPPQLSSLHFRRWENGDHDLEHISVVIRESAMHKYREYADIIQRLDNASRQHLVFRIYHKRLLQVFPSLCLFQNGSMIPLFRFLKCRFQSFG